MYPFSMAFELDTFRLQAFFEVVQTRNFSKAAKNLGITQSALSQRISRLEDQLQKTLFIRKPKSIELTGSGEELLRYCHAQKSLEEEFLALGGNEVLSGTIRIAGYSSVMRSLVVPALDQFGLKNPDVRFEYTVTELKDLSSLLFSGSCDYLLHVNPIQKQGLQTHLLGYEENVLISSKKVGETINRYLDHDSEDETTFSYFKLQDKKIPLQRSYFGDVYGIIDGVKLGYGKAIVSKHLVKNDKAVKIISAKKKMKNPIYLTYFERSYYPELHEKVVKELLKNVPKLL